MTSVPVVIAVLLTLMLVLAALWVGTQPLSEGEAYAASASANALLATFGGPALLAS
ncbi:MAG: hypothetical protein GX552_15585 [Chloroflexi bacterium]|nr:hypothetical protein [Chloroflexota bacterium]